MRQATNPLSGERVSIREVLNETIDTAQIDIFRALNDLSLPTNQSDIATHTEISRQVAGKHLSTFRNRGLVKDYEAGIEPTAGGKLFIESIENCLEEITEEEQSNSAEDTLSELTRSEYPVRILLTADGRQRVADIEQKLHEEFSDPPSKSTIKRWLRWFDDRSWLEKRSGEYRVTAAGTDVIIAYDELVATVRQLVEKAEWFQRLPLSDATVPVRELADATVIASNTASPSNVLGAAIRLCDLRTSRFRAFCSIFNPILFHAYKFMLNFGTEAEAILDWGSYQKAAQHEQTEFAAQSAYEHYQPLYLEESHTLGIGLYDDRKVAVGAYNERGEGKHIAMIVSSNPEIVEWAENLYYSYREEARCSSTDARGIGEGVAGSG